MEGELSNTECNQHKATYNAASDGNCPIVSGIGPVNLLDARFLCDSKNGELRQSSQHDNAQYTECTAAQAVGLNSPKSQSELTCFACMDAEMFVVCGLNLKSES